MDWKEKAIRTLRDSLCPVPEELNELDWKSGLSNKSERLAQHISAFSNYKGGGMLVYGVNNDGTCFDLSKAEMDTIIEKLGNIAKNNLCYSITIDHSVMEYEGHALLFIYIPEQKEKPVYLRGGDVFDSYYRSAGQTVKMSRNQVKSLIAESQGITFEERPAKEHLTNEEVLELLDYKAFYERIDKNVPSATDTILNNVAAIEEMTLPAVKFTKGEEHTRVLLYPQKQLKDMTKQEKIDACYQHACLMFEEDVPINNQSVRERFELNKNQSSVASRIIADTLEAGFIKPADDETASKKYMTYIPFYG